MMPLRGVAFVGLPVTGMEGVLQETLWTGAPVAVLSLGQEACRGGRPGTHSAQDGVLYMRAHVSTLPAALRLAAAKLGVPLLSLLVVHMDTTALSTTTSLATLNGLRVVHGAHSAHQVARLITDSHRSAGCALVGVVMRKVRWLDLLRRGFFPAVPQTGVCFRWMSAREALAGESACDMLLVKATDELMRLDDSGAPIYTPDMMRLLAAVPLTSGGPCIVDCPASLREVVNREAMAELLAGVVHDLCDAHCNIGVPASIKVPRGCDGPILSQQLHAAGLTVPVMIKSQAACGLEDAHAMVVLLSARSVSMCMKAFNGPIIAQQFVNHGGLVHKVSVIGSKVHCTTRPSIPDLIPEQQAAEDTAAPAFIAFDSQGLSSSLAHISSKLQSSGWGVAGVHSQPDPSIVHAATVSLKTRLGTSLFGFDILVDSSTGEQPIAYEERRMCKFSTLKDQKHHITEL